MSALIDYIDATGRLWGAARRRLDLKLERWPASIAGRLIDAMPAHHGQRCPEVFTGEVLRFNLAVTKPKVLTERQRVYVYVHYVIPLPLRQKVKILHSDRGTYFKVLVSAHRKIANTLEYT